MAVILRELIKSYKLYFDELSDQRTIDWPLMRTPLPVLAIVGFYIWFVFKLGPNFMKNRAPFNMDRIIQVYNLIQVTVCSVMTYRAFFVYGPWGKYSFACEPVDWGENEFSFFILRNGYLYFSLKIFDLLDTIFFVLRKKQSQITFLHVYHHAFMVLVSYYGMRFVPGGHGAFVVCINSFVHAVMYAYYFITNYNIEYRKNIWWKKHITQLQMFQFGSIFIHALTPIAFNIDCDYPRLIILLLIPQNLFIFLLFWDFYRKSYLSPKPASNHGKMK